MTFKLFNQTLSFDIRNGCGIDLEFVDGKAIWICRDGTNIESAVFKGTVMLFPFFSITFGRCFMPDEQEEYFND